MTADTLNTQPSQTHPAIKKNSTLKNTLKCVAVLTVISIVCVGLLAIANKFMQVKVTLDKSTASLINQIAPTGLDDGAALSSGAIKMIDLGESNFNIKSIDDYNGQYGSASQKVRALYSSKDKSGNITYVVEAEGKGYVDAIVMLVAYDKDNKVSALITKSQNESYWNHIKDEKALYEAFVGSSGKIESSQIATSTGVTTKFTLGGMADAVSIANDFIARLGGEVQVPAPYEVIDAAELLNLKKVTANVEDTKFTCYPVGTAAIDKVYIGDKGAMLIQSHGNGGNYGKVTLLVRVAENKAAELAYINESFSPFKPDHDSEPLKSNEKLNELFGGKSLADINAMTGDNLPGVTGVTESSNGLKQAVKNALEYAPKFDVSQFAKAEVRR